VKRLQIFRVLPFFLVGILFCFVNSLYISVTELEAIEHTANGSSPESQLPALCKHLSSSSCGQSASYTTRVLLLFFFFFVETKCIFCLFAMRFVEPFNRSILRIVLITLFVFLTFLFVCLFVCLFVLSVSAGTARTSCCCLLKGRH
jgi:hypothetical protein